MGALSRGVPFHHQHYTWVYPFYYSDLVLAGLAIVLVEVEAGWMVIEVVDVVGLVGEKYGVDGKMGLDSAGIGDMQKVVDRAVDRPVDMSGYHEYTLTNLEQIGLIEETKFARAWVHSMNSE